MKKTKDLTDKPNAGKILIGDKNFDLEPYIPLYEI